MSNTAIQVVGGGDSLNYDEIVTGRCSQTLHRAEIKAVRITLDSFPSDDSVIFNASAIGRWQYE